MPDRRGAAAALGTRVKISAQKSGLPPGCAFLQPWLASLLKGSVVWQGGRPEFKALPCPCSLAFAKGPNYSGPQFFLSIKWASQQHLPRRRVV